MGFISKLFGNSKVVEAGVEAADAVWFTDEEKAKWHLRLLKAYEPFKLAQRFLALIFCVPYIFLILVMFLASLFFEKDILGHVELLNELLGTPVTVILFFYFGGGAIEGTVRASVENKQKRS